MSDTVTSVEEDGTEGLVDQAEVGKLLGRGGDERFEVEWDNEAKVTPMGSLVFFAQYLQTGCWKTIWRVGPTPGMAGREPSASSS